MILRFFLNIATLVLLLVLFHIPAVQADFESDYQGYLKTYDSYRVSYEKYVSTRNQYLQYGTLNAKNDALTAVKDMMTQRDDVLMSYVSLLLGRNADAVFATQLADESAFLSTHKGQISALSSLEDAVKHSGEVEKRHIATQVLAKKVTATIILKKISTIKDTYTTLESEATNLIHNLKLQNKDVSVLERWLLDGKNKQLLADQKLTEASAKIAVLNATSLNSLNEEYNEIQFVMFEANQYLKEALRNMGELSESIKYGQF